MSPLPPLPVAGPLAVAGLLLAAHKILPRRLPDIATCITASLAALLCLVMAQQALHAPLVYWFGGWTPRPDLPVLIGFVVDPAGAAFAAFIGLLFAATIIFAWGYFDEVHAHFHVLMLLFMAGMIGFCLTHDLFNMFVWFEVMSVAGFALTGYHLRTAALEGALNFTVTNTIGAYLILAGIGLLYTATGALDLSAIHAAIAKSPDDSVTIAAFILINTGLLIKAAQVPFQFWLADAHAVAPSPVSVIFSGAMVAIGLFGIARLFWSAFAPSPEIVDVVRIIFLGFGVASALIGGLMAVSQRHLKRLLAFSTISHLGIMLIGFSLASQAGLAGMFTYLIGHGLVKGAMFMIAGILLAELASIDEIGLRGLGREIWPAGIAMALGGLLLAGLPLGLLGIGTAAIEDAAHQAALPWIPAIIILAAGLTGGAILRAAGRIFLGLGHAAGEETRAPTEAEQEKANRPLWVMLAPTVLLLGLALSGAHAAQNFASRAALVFMAPDNAGILGAAPLAPLHLIASGQNAYAMDSWISVALAALIAGFSLFRHRLPDWLTGGVGVAFQPLFIPLQKLHSGLIGDYIAWVTAGIAVLAMGFAFLSI